MERLLFAHGRAVAMRDKCTKGQEVVVVGWTEPAGSRLGIGALLVGVHDAKGTLRFAGKVGTGLSASTLRELRRRLGAIEREDAPVADPPRGAELRGVHWAEPRLVAEVEFTQWTKDGRLRHPVFKGLRSDKPARQIVRERPKPRPRGERAAMRADTATRVVGESRVAGIPISHPDRVLYPGEGVTKLELARYFETVAELMLPHVADRPLTLVRCPDGAAGECFFQKHPAAGVASVVRRVSIREKSGSGTYMTVDSAAGLVALVQTGALEFHVWGSRTDHVETPDRMILDLDPDPATPWPRVVDAARHVREVLERLGLAAFVKTTGGKGLHVVTPLRRRADQDWDVVKAFSKSVAERVARDAPERYTTNMSKAKRTGKVFLDYLRNGRGATAVAPYSPRAKPGATVAAPIAWDDLGARTAPGAFTVADAVKLTTRRDPWHGIGDAARPITQAMVRAAAE